MVRFSDVALPGALVVISTAELVATRYPGWGWAVVIEVIACTALALRRFRPRLAPTVALLVSVTPALIEPKLDEPATPIAIAIAAVFALARLNPGVGPGLVAMVLFVPLVGLVSEQDGFDPTDVVFICALIVPPFLLGRVVRRLMEQAEQLRAQQEIVRRDAIRTERDRIARDLHDVIAHSVSAMVVQTAAAQDLLGRDPAKVGELLENVARTGREALAETGRLLHVIRDDSDELGLAPAPGLDQIRDLVETHRTGGLEVTLEVDDELPVLSAGADVSAYRVVQEALTNAVRYAPDRKVVLRIAVDVGGLVIETSNWTGGRSGGRSQGSGLGLVGMAERLEVLGGDLTHGVDPDGRFVMRARIPLGGAS